MEAVKPTRDNFLFRMAAEGRSGLASYVNLSASNYLHAELDSQTSRAAVHAPGAAFGGDAAHRQDPQAGAGERRPAGSDVYRPLQFFSADGRATGAGGPQLRALAVRAQAPAEAGTADSRPAAH